MRYLHSNGCLNVLDRPKTKVNLNHLRTTNQRKECLIPFFWFVFLSSLEEMIFRRDCLPFKELRFEEPPRYMLQ